MMSSTIADRLAAVRRTVESAATANGRDPSSITLIAVGKTFSAEVVAEAVRAGATDLGENRVQEGVAKRPEVPEATWHLIGPLQSNKARSAIEVFDVIHTVDRTKIARRLQFLLAENWPDRKQRVLMEVNVGRERQKAGVEPENAHELFSEIVECDRLAVIGLMAIPPFGSEPEASRPFFRELRELRDRLEDRFAVSLPELSMGMSHDYEIAISEGATMVRVGTAIFGPRG